MMRKKVNIAVSIVEDDAPARQILAGLISRAEGFRCVGEHASAKSALDHLPQEKPDVVLMDINLPGLSGIECVRRLKPILPDTQFVMLTVYEDADHIFDALSAGASGYLLKRASREGLLAALQDVYAGGSPITSSIARKIVQSFRPADSRTPKPNELSLREQEVLGLLAKGYIGKDISDALGISTTTVSTYVRRIYEKLHVHSRAQAVATYAQINLNEGRWTKRS
ncbi:MAG TPA: response regulator transcription factor [Verrucomicrobiae bacterium]|jgi:DNA-binding NarL/FixJ family response regulator